MHAACAASASQPQPRGAGGREQKAGAEGSTGEGREAGQEEEEEQQKQEQEEQEDQEEQEQEQKQQEQKQDEEEGLRTANPPATEPQSAAWRELTGEPLASPQRFFIPSYSGNWIAENGISLITVVRSAPANGAPASSAADLRTPELRRSRQGCAARGRGGGADAQPT